MLFPLIIEVGKSFYKWHFIKDNWFGIMRDMSGLVHLSVSALMKLSKGSIAAADFERSVGWLWKEFKTEQCALLARIIPHNALYVLH